MGRKKNSPNLVAHPTYYVGYNYNPSFFVKQVVITCLVRGTTEEDLKPFQGLRKVFGFVNYDILNGASVALKHRFSCRKSPVCLAIFAPVSSSRGKFERSRFVEESSPLASLEGQILPRALFETLHYTVQ